MSAELRSILIIISIGTFYYITRKIKKSQVSIVDSGFWVLFSLVLIVLAIVPQLATFCAKILGVETTINFVFLAVFFILLLEVFILSLKVSKLESKIIDLAGEIAMQGGNVTDQKDKLQY